jgi:hypothetical protein
VDSHTAERIAREHVDVVGELELEKDRPWATTWRVPTPDGIVWFKACGDVQRFEPDLTAALGTRWPNVVAPLIAYEPRHWILLEDAGTPFGVYGNQPEAWHAVLPKYAELQRGETVHANEHLASGVPDMRFEILPARFDDFTRRPELPLDPPERERLRALAPRFLVLCDELAESGLPYSIQHDDLHFGNVFDDGTTLRVLDWGDSSVAHPFFSLVVTFQFLEEVSKLPPDDPWFGRLSAAYLEPWGPGYERVLEIALRVGSMAYAIAWARQWEHLPDGERAEFTAYWGANIRRAMAQLER